MLIDNVNKFWGNLDLSYKEFKLEKETKYEYLIRLTNYSTADNKTDVEYIKSRLLMENPDGDFELFYKLDRADKILSRYKFNENNFEDTDSETFLEDILHKTSLDSSAVVEKDFSISLLKPFADISTVEYIELSSEEMFNRFNSVVTFTTCIDGRPVVYRRKNDSFDRLFVYGQSYDGLEVKNSSDDFAKVCFNLCRVLSQKGLLKEGTIIFNPNFMKQNNKEFILDFWGTEIRVAKSSTTSSSTIIVFKHEFNGLVWDVILPCLS